MESGSMLETGGRRSEVWRRTMLERRPDLLSPTQTQQAIAESVCRELNHSDQACARLQQSIRDICETCALRSQVLCPEQRLSTDVQ